MPATPTPSVRIVPATRRVEAVDILRGVVIVIMALDHVREYFSVVRGMEASQTSLPYFLTRWITHYCAPTFCFLAGTSAYLSLGRRRAVPQLSRFLLTRGLWLIVAELTIVNFGWFYHLRYPFDFGFGLQTIWMLGASMLALAALVHLPVWMNAAIGIAMIGGHNLLLPAGGLRLSTADRLRDVGRDRRGALSVLPPFRGGQSTTSTVGRSLIPVEEIRDDQPRGGSIAVVLGSGGRGRG